MSAADTRMLPPFAYYGGKTRIADRIVAVLPSHEHCGQRGTRTEVLWSNRPLTEQTTFWASEATAS